MRLINKEFARLFAAQAVSVVGDYVYNTVLVLWISTELVTRSTYGPIAVSGVMVAIAAGVLLVAPIAGVFVDRWDNRRTMICSDVIRAGLISVLAIVAMVPPDALDARFVLVLIYVVVLLATGTSQFFNTSRFSMLVDLVKEDERAQAIGILQATGYTAAIIGPPLAAPLLFGIGAPWALWINVLSFLVSALLIRSIRPQPSTVVIPADPAAASRPALSGFLADLKDGLRFVGGNAVLRILVGSLALFTIGAGTVNTLNVFFLEENLHENADLYGTLGMGEGIGAVVGALSAGWLCRRFRDVVVYGIGMAAVGAGLVVYARLGDLWPAVAVLALIGIPLGAINTALTPIVLRTTPREYMGRAFAAFGPVQQISSLLSALISGWLVSTAWRDFHHEWAGLTFGRIDTVYLVAGVIIVVAGILVTVALSRAQPAPAPAVPVPIEDAPVKSD